MNHIINNARQRLNNRILRRTFWWLLILCVSMIAFMPSAFAGHWEMDLHPDGSTDVYAPAGSYSIPFYYSSGFGMTAGGSPYAISYRIHCTFSPVLTWVPDPNTNDPVPDEVDIQFYAFAYGFELGSQGVSSDEVTLECAFGPPLTDGNASVYGYPGVKYSENTKYLKIQTHGQTTVTVETKPDFDIQYNKQNSSFAEMGFTCQAEIIDFSISGGPSNGGASIVDTPRSKEIDGTVKLNWRDVGIELPLEPYWEGDSWYELSNPIAYIPNSSVHNVFSAHYYEWSVSGAPDFLGDVTLLNRPEGSNKRKEFVFDFGDDAATLPTTINTVGVVTGADENGDPDPDAPDFSANIKINWHSPWGDGIDWGNLNQQRVTAVPGTLIDVPPYNDENGNPVPSPMENIEDINPGDIIYPPGNSTPKVVTDKRTNPDGTITLDYSFSLPPEFTEQDDIDDQIAAINSAYQEAIRAGATGVKLGLEAYKGVAEFYAFGPLYELGGGLITSLGSKAIDLLADAARARSISQNLRTLATKAENVAGTIRAEIQAGGKTEQEIAALEQKATQMDKYVGELESQAGALDSAASKAENLASNSSSSLDDIQFLQENGAGAWTGANESMSYRAAEYQSQITGVNTGEVYLLNGVKFDGFQNGILLEAKGPGYDSFVLPNGQFKSFFNGQQSLLSQAQNQVAAANGNPIEWHVAEENFANALNNLFTNNGISGITIIHDLPIF